VRRLERGRSRADVSREYLKNTLLPFIGFPRGSREQRVLLPVVCALLQLDEAESKALHACVVEGKSVQDAFSSPPSPPATRSAGAGTTSAGAGRVVGAGHAHPHMMIVGANELHRLKEATSHAHRREERTRMEGVERSDPRSDPRPSDSRPSATQQSTSHPTTTHPTLTHPPSTHSPSTSPPTGPQGAPHASPMRVGTSPLLAALPLPAAGAVPPTPPPVEEGHFL
jgi:GRIP domain